MQSSTVQPGFAGKFRALLRRGEGGLRLDDVAFESRLVWIFGSPRSGSTWLLDLLVHPLTVSGGWSESDLGVARREAPEAGAPQAIPINEPYVPQHLTPPLFQDQAASGDLGLVTLNSFRHGQPNYFFSDQYADAWRPHLRRLVLARMAAQSERLAAAFSVRDPWVVIKEPNGSLGADFVMSLLPHARLIFLLRDGRDVVDSMLDAQAPGSWLARPWEEPAGDPGGQRLELVRRQSALWLARTKAVQDAYEAHAPDLRLLVRYEDARRDPAGVLAELDRWLGLRRSDGARASAVRSNDFDSYPAEAKGPGKPLRAARPGLWRENLSREEQLVMAEVMGAKLEELGYS